MLPSEDRPRAEAPASFRSLILELVAQIPQGRVMTYGQLATLAGHPGAARQAGFVMNTLMEGTDLPWHRVINAQGRVSTHKLGFGDLQEKLLSAEGIEWQEGRLDLGRYQWWPSDGEGEQEVHDQPRLL